ncbi:membrane fusogenic activity [mine drainage metagenome]|uniref:Membrane fusogenic activity n=1 Tax=mine drainage metagenome TaxID=410659 RepID=A0A1J5R7M7_9ZZZZ
MLDSKIIDDISRRISALIAESPVADIENNLRPVLQSIFAKLELVTREEFDIQAQVLQRTREQLTQLEHRLAALESRPSPEE